MSKFEVGNPGGPGRPPGVRNKYKIKTVKEALAESGINPIEKVLELMPSIENESSEQAARIWLQLQQWVDPKTFKMENGEQRTGYPSALPRGDEGVVLDVLKPYETASNG